MSTAPVVIVASADRTLRLTGERQLRARGVQARVASRPAELAKALADGVACLVILGRDAADDALAALVPRERAVVRVADATALERLPIGD